MTTARKTVIIAAAALFLIWAVGHFGRLTADEEGLIRFVLGTLFALLILFRWKSHEAPERIPGWAIPAVGATGALLALLGIIFGVHQFEWLGLIFVLYACLRWSLPIRFSGDLILAFLLLYWVHPLPGQVFGRFQLLMQFFSVKASEWVLHCANARVWADGMILYSAGDTFGVPESCSGMRTAVTVFLCTLGAGVLLRLRWYELLCFLALGVVQVLLLNVTRIAGMVFWTPQMPPGWAGTFLHDTLGVFLLVSILLIQVEISLWKFWIEKRRKVKMGIRDGELEHPELGSMLPSFWRNFVKWGWRIGCVLLLVAVAAGAVYKSRHEHRVEMIRGVVEGLMQREPEIAERAVLRVLAFDPDDRGMLHEHVRIQLRRNRFEEALDKLDGLPGKLNTLETVWKGWALMALDRGEEAMVAIDVLPDKAKSIPGVAMIRAEFAARQDDPQKVSTNIVLAVGWRALSGRVRALFPYLAAHEQWRAIAECNDNIPYEEAVHALIAIRANLRARNVAGAENALRLALQEWPNDPRFLRYIGWAAMNRPGREWQDRLTASFTANMMDLNADLLSEHLGNFFNLERPDLAWLAYMRLRSSDPLDPALHLAAAQFGDAWFRFRRRELNVPGAGDFDTLDVTPLYSLTAHLTPFASFWRLVPLRDELADVDNQQVQAKYAEKCLAELESRSRKAGLNSRMQIMHAFVFAQLVKPGEAHAMLDKILEERPEAEPDILLRHANLYAQEGRWEDVYETLRDYAAASHELALDAALITVSAMISLNLGISAMEVVDRTRDLFPGSLRLDLAESAIWNRFRFKERALFVLARAGLEHESPASVQLLYDTGRFEEAEKRSKALGVRIREDGLEKRPIMVFPPAELSVAKQWPPPLSEDELNSRADAEDAVLERSVSPFLRRLAALTAKWYRARGEGEHGDIRRWENIGRDPLEKAAALHRLAVLSARQERDKVAIRAVEHAIGHLPRSTMLHRMLIGLSGGRSEAVKNARKACPNDPEIWLASLVTRLRDEKAREWVSKELQSAISADRFSVATVMRAGDLSFRVGLIDLAAAAAKYGVDKGRGMLPPYVLALRCALVKRNWKLARDMALSGAERAHDPSPFFETLVDIKMAQRKTDGDLVTALEFLRGRFPNDSTWTERLGHIYFEKRDMKGALRVLSPLISGKVEKVRAQLLIMAAEAARQQGDWNQAARILETARTTYPERISVLNNLVYCLAMNPATIERARTLLDELLEKEGASFAVLDTAAMVYLHSGQLNLAKQYMQKALASIEEGHYSALETRLNAARIFLHSGDLDEAKKMVNEVRRHPRRDSVVDKDASELLRQINKAVRRKAVRRGPPQ